MDKIQEHETEKILYESNGVGLAAILLIKKRIGQHRQLIPYNATINKDVRILSHYEFVQKYFYFDENYKQNEEYRLFIHDLTSYSKEGDNKHKKDAIDVCCAAANAIKAKYHKLLYS